METETDTSNWLTRKSRIHKKSREGILFEGMFQTCQLGEWRGVEAPGGDSSLFSLVLSLRIIFHWRFFFFVSIEKTVTKKSSFIFRTPGKIAWVSHLKWNSIKALRSSSSARANKVMTVSTNMGINDFFKLLEFLQDTLLLLSNFPLWKKWNYWFQSSSWAAPRFRNSAVIVIIKQIIIVEKEN